jgi:hypothetical protein
VAGEHLVTGPDASAEDSGGTGRGERADAAPPHCDAHTGAATELRALALTALDRLEPAVQRWRTAPPAAPGAATCAGCPVCAVLAVFRGERPELTGRMAAQLDGLLAVLRAALEEGDPGSAAPAPDAGTSTAAGPDAASQTPTPTPSPPASAPSGGSGRRVQRIPVERVAR